MTIAVYAVGGFLLLLIVIVLLRTVSQNRFEVKNSDILLALIPVALGLVLSGHIKELTVGDLKIVPAVTNATKSLNSAIIWLTNATNFLNSAIIWLTNVTS